MTGSKRSAALVSLLAFALSAPAAQAQTPATSGQNGSAQEDNTARLRAEIEKKRQELHALEDQLADQEQKRREAEWAAEDKERRQKLAAEDAKEDAKRDAKGDAKADGGDEKVVSYSRSLSERRDLYSGGAPGSVEKKFFTNVATDQKMLWLAPTKVRLDDAQFLVPFGTMTLGLIGSDTSIEQKLPSSPTTISHAKSFSTYGALALAGSSGAFYLWGKATDNQRSRETGLLSGEAMVDTFLNVELLKFSFGRQRPLEGNGKGLFWQGGASFPSEHSAIAFAAASVISQEYPGFMTKFFTYGGATAVAAARVIGRQHFSSDVFIGSAVGWYIGHQVYRAHHNPELGGAEWGTFTRTYEPRPPETMASPYVPLDSWIYSAFDRLAALGYARSSFADFRPWTRLECARLLEEDREVMPTEGNSQAVDLFRVLRTEFAHEIKEMGGGRNVDLQVESVYSRFTGIAGPPLTDGYHFGQTLINDFGRPYGEGVNLVEGASGWATAGPFAFYARGEYQHGAAPMALSDQARQVAGTIDNLPPLAPGANNVNRAELLDAYVAFKLNKWQFSFGRQSLSWGPGLGGAMMFSDNAAPITMLQINQVSPAKLPSIFKYLGPVRTDFFIGRLEGADFIFNPSGLVGQYSLPLDPQPYINGQRVSFKPTPNFEFGFSRTTLFASEGYPLTWHSFFRSVFALTNTNPGDPNKPGDRRSGFDMTYRIPKLRNRLTFYADGFTEDQFTPVAYWDRSAWRAGLYLVQFPAIPKLDLRVEGVYTDLPIGGGVGHGFFYYDATYRSGYRNDGFLMGDWIGRQGQGAQAWATYHLNARNAIQLDFRHQKVSQEFLPNGGTVTDFGVKADYWIRPELSLSTFAQYEKWNFPVLAPGEQSNMTTSVQLTFWPWHQKSK